MSYVAQSRVAVFPTRYGYRARGMGSGGQILSVAGSVAPFTGPAAPFVSLGVALTGLLMKVFSGCGQTCVLASNEANQVEQYLQKNLALYQQSGHTQSEQAAALANFDNAWSILEQYCGNPQLGKAGQNCIGDRQAGACKWKNDGAGGPAGSGSVCWNWFVGYRDPIANDPNVVPDPSPISTLTAIVPASVADAANQVTGFFSGISPTWLIAGLGLAGLGLLFAGGSE